VKRWALLALLAGCKCSSGATADAGAPVWLEAGADVSVARAPDVEELWTQAADAGDDELERLALVEGTAGLEERAASPGYRVTAIRAMAFTPSFSAFPTLGAAAAHGSEDEAKAAVDAADAIAARKREQVDPEDDDELAAGCASLLAAAKDTTRPRPVRIGAVRALRMLSDRTACVKSDAIPTDVDVK
jgi:hypothetical protein